MTVKDIRERWTRYTIDVPLRYLRVAEGGGRSKGGRARNLNFRGAWVDLPEQVEPESVLEITLATPVVKLTLVGRVVWAHSGSRDGQYLHGVRFRTVTSEQREGFRALFAYERASPARLSCFLAATCQRNANGYVTIPGIVRDLSEGGVCIRLPQRVAPGNKLRIQAATPFGKIVADAHVVWADQARGGLPLGKLCRHGLRFLHIHLPSEPPLRAVLDGIPPRAVVA
jgi:hypothetical protein